MAASPVMPREGISCAANSWPAILALLPALLPPLLPVAVKCTSEIANKCQICNSCKCVAHCSATSCASLAKFFTFDNRFFGIGFSSSKMLSGLRSHVGHKQPATLLQIVNWLNLDINFLAEKHIEWHLLFITFRVILVGVDFWSRTPWTKTLALLVITNVY